MAGDQTFDALREEFRRVGVDPDTFSAMLALRPEDTLRALEALPDNAGTAAFLAQLRRAGHATGDAAGAESAPDQRRQGRSA